MTTTTTTPPPTSQEPEQFQTEIDYEQSLSSLFDLSLIEYSPSQVVVDRNNFVHFTPGKFIHEGRQHGTRMCVRSSYTS